MTAPVPAKSNKGIMIVSLLAALAAFTYFALPSMLNKAGGEKADKVIAKLATTVKDTTPLPFCESKNHCGYMGRDGQVEQNGKWGYVNTNGELITPALFDDTYGFTDNGLALIIQNEKYGYINTSGEIAIPAQFYVAHGFADNGLAKVMYGERQYYINAESNPIGFKLADIAAE